MPLPAPRRLGVIVAVAAALLASCGPTSTPATNPSSGASPPSIPVPGATAPADSIYFGQRNVPAKHARAIRVTTYNLLNLFDDIDDPYYSGDLEDIDDAKPPSQRQALADAIHRLDSDILALEEVESESALREFRDRYLSDMGYQYLVSLDTGDPRGIECAVLSRFPVSNVQTWAGLELGGIHPDRWGSQPNQWAGQPITFKRSPLRVDVTVPSPESEASGAAAQPYVLTLFVLHNKSGGPGGYWREAESHKIVELVSGVLQDNPAANVLVLGDLNAMSNDASVQILLNAGLSDLYPYDPEHHAETISHESGRRIDHILASAPVLPEIIDGSAFILGTPGRPPGSDWRSTPEPPGLASDHYPVSVELHIGDR